MFGPEARLALYMEGAFESKTGKMGLGVLRYSPNPVVAVIDKGHAGERLADVTGIVHGAPIVAGVGEAADLGAEVLILGIAPPGGQIPDDWRPAMDEAVARGLSLVNGLHEGLSRRFPTLGPGQFVWDVRVEPPGIGVGGAQARLMANRRVLTVGTDMSVGKMTAGLEIARSARAKGVETAFVATGQVGIVITGAGVPLDAVRLDYASGAVENETLKYSASQLIVIEGQGSLIHPGSSATLPLMRGSCPTHLVLCHRAGMTRLPRVPWVEVPPLKEVVRLFEDTASACGTFGSPKVVGIALNTSHLDEGGACGAVREVERDTGLPVCDPVRDGAGPLLDAILRA
ncbi:MAG: DUF1611 domain-containing protein [Armatimonadetes bacterium]|nr:DUF1611 domain-containing protein [Armatimonadota bacterium]